MTRDPRHCRSTLAVEVDSFASIRLGDELAAVGASGIGRIQQVEIEALAGCCLGEAIGRNGHAQPILLSPGQSPTFQWISNAYKCIHEEALAQQYAGIPAVAGHREYADTTRISLNETTAWPNVQGAMIDLAGDKRADPSPEDANQSGRVAIAGAQDVARANGHAIDPVAMDHSHGVTGHIASPGSPCGIHEVGMRAQSMAMKT